MIIFDLFEDANKKPSSVTEGEHDAKFRDDEDSFYHMADFAHKQMRKGQSLQDVIQYLRDNNYLEPQEVNSFVKQVRGEKWNESVTENQYEIHHLDPEGRRKAIYHHGKGYTDDVVRKDTQYHQERNPRDTFRVFKDKQPFDWQGVTEAEGPGRVDPILYKALARMTKGGYDDAKIALAIEFGLLDMKHNYAIANNYIPKLVDLYNQKHGVAEGALTEMNRRGFLKGLAGFAASAAAPTPILKLLSTPAGISSLSTPAGVTTLGMTAGLALLKGIKAQLDQYDPEDDDAYFEAWEDMAAELGFDSTDADGEYIDPLGDLINLYNENPKKAAQQLITHIQSEAVNPDDITSTFRPRDDWRKRDELNDPEDDSKPYDYYASNTPEKNKIVIYTTDFDGNIMDTYIRDNRQSDPVEELKKFIRSDGSSSGSRFYKYTKYSATNGGKPVKIDNEKYIDPSKLSNALSPDQVREKMYKMWDADIDPNVATVSTTPGALARAATIAKAGIDKLSNLRNKTQPVPTVKDMGPIQRVKPAPALPAPTTEPELNVAPNLKQKVKTGVAESLDDHERYQYIVTLKSGKRIRFLCGADCDVKTYIERKYNEPVVDIKDQGIVGEPPVELLPGEIKEGSQSFHNGMQVKLTPEYADRPDEVFTVAHCDRERGRCWIGDEQGRGWYASFDQLIPVEDDEDDEGEIKEAIKTIKGPHGRQEVDTDTPGVTRVRQTSRLGAKSFGLPSRPAVATAGVNTPIGKNASSLTNPVSSIRRTRPRLDRDDSSQLASYSTENTIKELAPTQKQPSEQEGKINAELRKLRAQYPDARSDLEAVAIGGQEAHADARQHLARVDAIVSKLDRAADQLQSVNTDQDSELNVLDRENNDLEQKVKDLEKRIGQLKQPRSKSADQPAQAQSTEPKDEPAKEKDNLKTEPAKKATPTPAEVVKIGNILAQQDIEQQEPEKKAGKTADAMTNKMFKKSRSPRDDISPDERAMIQRIMAKQKEPYQPSAQDVTRAAEKTKTQAELFKQYNDMAKGETVTEVSPEYIERYKKEHGKRATAADQAGDYAKGHEHFKKINQLTKQQFQRAQPQKVDEISNFMTQPTEPVSPEEQWKRRIRLLAKQYQTNASSLAALARENGPDSAEAVAYEYLRDPSKIRVPGTATPASAVNWDEVIRRLPMGLSGMALLQAAEEYLINNKGMLRSTVRSLLNNDENQRSLSAAYAKKNTTSESVTEESDNEAVEQAIARRIMVGRTDLLLKYGPRKVMQAVEEVADYVGAVDEIGSSDVSAWVNQVERELGGVSEAKATSTRLDPKCWTGKKIGNPKTKVKGGVRVNNCVPK